MEQAISYANSKTLNDRFFLYVPLVAAHSPWENNDPPRSLVNSPEYFENTQVDTFHTYGAKLEAIDTKIGHFMQSVKPEILANTTIILMADNGTPSNYWLDAQTGGREVGAIYDWLLNSGDEKFKGEWILHPHNSTIVKKTCKACK